MAIVDRNINLISILHFHLVVIVILERTISRSLQRDGRKGQKREDRFHHRGLKVWKIRRPSSLRISVVVTRKKREFASRWRLHDFPRERVAAWTPTCVLSCRHPFTIYQKSPPRVLTADHAATKSIKRQVLRTDGKIDSLTKILLMVTMTGTRRCFPSENRCTLF